MMETIQLTSIDEVLYKEVLANGLTVYLLPKKGFSKTYATYTTKYGSIDREFIPVGQQESITVPDGIAHFLEHKMFEKEEGDIFQTFSEQGASANAFTSFTRTAYLFSATDRVQENLTTLLDFVQQPYFTKETVEKEKGIIAQEIQMYDDNPDWKSYFGAVENMYHTHPVRIDIAGTVESIQAITKDDLYTCYDTFYHPSNMTLFVIGALEPEEMLTLIRSNQEARSCKRRDEVVHPIQEETLQVAVKDKTIEMDVFKPKFTIGLKLPAQGLKGAAYLKRELAVQLGMDLLYGTKSDFYDALYDQGVIDESFGYDFTLEHTFSFATIGTDTEDAEAFKEAVFSTYEQLESIVQEEALELLKRRKIGQFIRALNSPEFIANQFTHYTFHEVDFFSHIEVYESLTTQDIIEAMQSFIQEDNVTTLKIIPNGSQND